MAKQKQDDQPELTYSSYVRTQDVIQKTCRRRWMIGRSGERWSGMYSYGPPHMAKQKQDDQPELTYSSYVRTQDVIQKTCRRRWMIGRSGERWSGISVLAARHDDDDDIKKYVRKNPFYGASKKHVIPLWRNTASICSNIYLKTTNFGCIIKKKKKKKKKKRMITFIMIITVFKLVGFDWDFWGEMYSQTGSDHNLPPLVYLKPQIIVCSCLKWWYGLIPASGWWKMLRICSFPSGMYHRSSKLSDLW